MLTEKYKYTVKRYNDTAFTINYVNSKGLQKKQIFKNFWNALKTARLYHGFIVGINANGNEVIK